jgi:4-hydroxy-tetrahydrodipicolinate synthase
MPFNLTGTGVAVVTPFKADKSIDHKALKQVLDFIIAGSVEYVVALGTTGETPVLSKSDRMEVLSAIVEGVAGRVPVVLGMGGNDTHELLDHMSSFNMDGVHALLSVTPYYNKPSQAGLYAHYKAVSEHTDLPIILYNVPPRTACNLTAETTLRLAGDFKNIVGIKEASGDFAQIMQILHERPAGFQVYSGDDLLTLPMLAAGADGVISVIANGCPTEFSQMTRFALAGDYAAARDLHYRLLPLMQLIFLEGNPTGIKALLHARGLIHNELRLPMVSASVDLSRKIAQYLQAAGL